MTSVWVPLTMVLVVTTGAWVLGHLTASAFLLPAGEAGRLDAVGRASLGRAQIGSWIWFAATLVAIPPALAEALNISLSDATQWATVRTYAWDVPATHALMISGFIAIAVTTLTFGARRIGSVALLVVLAGIGVAAPGVTVGHSGISDHGLHVLSGAIALLGVSLWAGSVGALLGVRDRAANTDEAFVESVRRHGRGVPAYATATLLGVLGLGLARMGEEYQLWSTPFGLLAVIATVVAVAPMTSWNPRSRWRQIHALPALVSLALLVGVALLVATHPSGASHDAPLTLAEQLIGESMPEPITIARALGPHLDTAAIVTTLILGGLYLAGVARLRRRGDHWPLGRTVAMIIGLLSLLAVTVTQIGAYSTVLFSTHMIQHMTLSMVTPVFLVLSGPITLALRAIRPAPRGQRGPREWVVAFQHSRIVRALTTPIVALIVYVTSLYGLYFTPLFSTLMSSHLGHLAMMTHFVLAGYFFYWMIIGVDPTPKPVPYWARLLLLLAGIAIHAIFGVIVMVAPTAIAGDWYTRVAPPWLGDPLTDQYVAGGVAWAYGEIPTLIIMIALVWQWSKAEERDNRRLDRKADRDGDAELTAYNDYLATLSRPSPRR